MKTTRVLTIIMAAVLLAGCASRSQQATTGTTPAPPAAPPPPFQPVAIIHTNPLVVTIVYTNPLVFIYGEVKRPGHVVWNSELTLTNLIAMAGGFTDFANRARIEVRRSGGKVELYNYFRIRNGSTNDPALKRIDLVYVPRRSWF
jgi:protein involved in polysaccharide export with SLBB domain